MKKTTLIGVGIILGVLVIAFCFYNIVRAENSTRIDYSWVQRLVEEKVILVTEIPKLEKDIYEKKKRLENIECKIQKVDRDATCEQGL